MLTRSPLHHRGTDLEVPWLRIRATASVWLCRSLLGLQDDGVRDEGVVCNEGEDARAVTVTRQDAMQLGLRSAGGA